MDIELKVKQIIADSLSCDLDEINDEVRISDYGIDSLDLMDLEFQLNNEFDLRLNGDLYVDDNTTVKDVVDFVRVGPVAQSVRAADS